MGSEPEEKWLGRDEGCELGGPGEVNICLTVGAWQGGWMVGGGRAGEKGP